MIVLDASAAVLLLLGAPARGDWVGSRLAREDLHVPQVFEYEIASAVRAGTLRGDVSPARAWSALVDMANLPLTCYPPQSLLERIWELRTSLSVHDASYVALAEALDAPLITADGRMARAHGHTAAIELVPA